MAGMRENEVVWLTEERTFARLMSMGAFFSMVKYTRMGVDYEVLIENDEIEGVTDESD